MRPGMDDRVLVIAVHPRGFIQALPELKQTDRTSAYAYHRQGWKSVGLFHRDGQRYEVVSVAPDRPRGLFSKILANTVYNPRFVAAFNYRAVGAYGLADLKGAVSAAIRADDDVLTQFHSEEELLDRLARVSTFDDMVGFVRYIQAPDDAA